MRVLVLGAGAVGGYFGARLVEAGGDVTFLVRQGRAQQLSRDGLALESALGNFKAPVATITSAKGFSPPDIVMLTCKAYSLAGAMEAIAPAIGPETVLLPLLNGIAHLQILEKRFPKAEIWSGMAHIGVTLSDAGTVLHLNDLHTLAFGPRNGGDLEKAKALLAAFAPANADVKLSHDIQQDLWDKLVFLATLAGSTCLMRANIGTILETAGGEDFILRLLDECTAIARAEGFAPNEVRIGLYRAQLTEAGSSNKSSMLRDIERGAPIEVEHIIGDMAARAERHAIATPYLKSAYIHLQAYEANRCAQAF